MQVPLSLIAPSPTPVRTAWDEERMEELAQSIREQGVIVPIKVRPLLDIDACPEHGLDWLDGYYEHYNRDTGQNEACRECFENVNRVEWVAEADEEGATRLPHGPLFEIVYGHRRVEAARRAGLTDIEATLEGLDNQDALLQALIENVQREDMTDFDEGRAYAMMRDVYGLEVDEIARRVGKSAPNISQHIRLIGTPAASVLEQSVSTSKLEASPVDVANALRRNIPDPDTQRAVAQKIIDEGLGREQYRRVIEAVAVAPSGEARKRLLEWEYSPVLHDPEHVKERAREHGAHDPLYHAPAPAKQKQWEETPEVKQAVQGVLEATKRWNTLMDSVRTMADVGKLAPESRQFLAHRARKLAQALTTWADELEVKDGN